MLEKIYGINTSRLVRNVSIYFITIIPSCIILYKYNPIGFWFILLIENIVTHYLFDNVQLLKLIDEEVKARDMLILSISIGIDLIMLLFALVKYSKVFWTIIIAEVAYMTLMKVISKVRQSK